MPELPDVAVFKNYFDATSLNQRVERVEVKDRKVVTVSPGALKKALEGHAFKSTGRKGKYLFAETDAGAIVAMHFGMTGGLAYFKPNDDEPKYARLLFRFVNGTALAYVNARRLGRVSLSESIEAFTKEHDLGPDALEVSGAQCTQLLQGKKGAIKPALMDQGLISGIGNIYADEILYQSKIHPQAKVERLTIKQLRDLCAHMHRILKVAIDKEADVRQFPDNYLLPHRREGEACPSCSGKINRIKVGGRSTYYCPTCQKH